MSLEGVKMTKKNRYNREFRTPEEIKKEHEAEKAVEETVEPVADDKTDELKTEVEEEPVAKLTPEEQIPEVKHGTVIAELLNVRTAPEVGDNVIGKLKKNTPVEIITKGGASNDWYFVKGEMATGISVSGYVMSKFIKED